MRTFFRRPFPGILRWCLLLFFALAARELRAEDLNIEAQLIWGTNADKSPDDGHKAVDKATADKLRNVFKWKNYFLVNKQNVVVPNRSTKQIHLSKQCTVEITELQGPKVEVKLIGDHKPVNKTVKPLSKGETFVIAGDDKNETAWFVVITQN
jgi:hypothetical protein